MDSEIQASENQTVSADAGSPQFGQDLTPQQPGALHRVFVGPQGLRAGWSVAIYLSILIGVIEGMQELGKLAQKFAEQSGQQAAAKAHTASETLSPVTTIFGEGIFLAFIAVLTLFMALIERRNPLEYNLRGPGIISRFFSGLLAGFVSLSALVGGLYLGGWTHFGPVALHGSQVVSYAAIWALGFLIVGFTEEGVCRCYLQFTLNRGGINFWQALGIVGLMSAMLILFVKLAWIVSLAAWGIYIFALLGLIPCLWLQVQKAQDNAFWFAAWATSTFFGFVHTSNNGENWIGIFAAAAIGFVFCVSVYVTGSAWWAIGCHAAWDWAETFFYGTADSGMAAKGHFLTTAPSGPPLWSGGTDGPEGSLLVLPAILLILAIVLVQYGRGKKVEHAIPSA
jgi:uncharacterized protein